VIAAGSPGQSTADESTRRGQLDATIAALRRGTHLLVDDMTPDEFMDDRHAQKTTEVRNQLRDHLHLVSVEIAWSTGLILSTRRRS
jgi:hypothetical protein